MTSLLLARCHSTGRDSEPACTMPFSTSSTPLLHVQPLSTHGVGPSKAAASTRCFIWGNCQQHPGRSLQPHVLGPRSQNAGQLRLYCSAWFKMDAEGKRGCWYSEPFPRESFAELSSVHKAKYTDLAAALRRNAAPASMP